MKNFNKAIIEFLNGNVYPQYPYACYDENIKPGDLVVLKTGHHGFALGRIASITVPASAEIDNPVKDGREVISKVDMTAFEERQAKAKKLAALEREMEKKIKEFTKLDFLETMAEKHPELKELLDQYKKLQ